MNTFSRRLFTASGLALLATALPAQFLWSEGQHYTRVGPAEPPDVPAGKLAVTEVFSYVCGGCYQAREAVEQFRKGLPADVTQREPAASAVIYGGLEARSVAFEGVAEALSVPTADLRLFGKPEAFERRRMGVATARGADVDQARVRAREAAGRVRVVAG